MTMIRLTRTMRSRRTSSDRAQRCTRLSMSMYALERRTSTTDSSRTQNNQYQDLALMSSVMALNSETKVEVL